MPETTTETAERAAPTPPVSGKRPVTTTRHGVTRTDEYAWLRGERWQEVLRDPARLDADIRAHLEAEVDYYETMTAHLEPLRKTLAAEVRGRIKEDESSVPLPDGDYASAVRYREGGEYPVHYRTGRDGSDEEILFDGDEEGEGADASTDRTMTAYGVDRREGGCGTAPRAARSSSA